MIRKEIEMNHSTYTLCLDCREFGINMPGNKTCDCGSTNTITSKWLYYILELRNWVRVNLMKNKDLKCYTFGEY